MTSRTRITWKETRENMLENPGTLEALDALNMETFRAALQVLLYKLSLLALREQYQGKSGYGCPMQAFIDNALLQGVDAYVAGILERGTIEYRLNGAGLKLYLTYPENGFPGEASIGGDQAEDYPEFVAEARRLLKTHNLERP